jgi:predicted TIM-barrel fold metal-dependent hydrolase
MTSSYDRVFDAALEALGPMAPRERSAFLGGNAKRFYRL